MKGFSGFAVIASLGADHRPDPIGDCSVRSPENDNVDINQLGDYITEEEQDQEDQAQVILNLF